MTETDKERFDAKWEKDGECWVWQASHYHSGYGGFYINGQMVGSHRASFKIYKGEINEEKYVLHTCGNKMCVNPEHLYLGNQQDNINDAMDNGKILSGEESPTAKLTRCDVEEIKEKYSSGNITQRELGSQYGADASTVSKIVNGERWQ